MDFNNVSNFVSAVPEVQNRLADDLSRDLYSARLKYLIYRNMDEFRDDILDISEKNTLQWEICEVDRMCERKDVPGIVIFGSGVNGKQTYRLLKRSKYKDTPILFCDNDAKKWGTECCGSKIISPYELEKAYGNCICVIGSSKYRQIIFEQLLDGGFPNENILYPAMGILYASMGWQYFDYFKPDRNEVFVDGGVFDGRTAGRFARWANNDYEAIYGFEANPYCIERCRNYYMANLHDAQIMERGLWSERTQLSFRGGYSGAARVSDDGNVVVEADTMDNLLGENRVSFIKMDIEGAEYHALLGARKTIMKNRPRMALSIYHNPWDIIEIPSLLLQYDDSYRFAIRQYKSIGDETVLYAF